MTTNKKRVMKILKTKTETKSYEPDTTQINVQRNINRKNPK